MATLASKIRRAERHAAEKASRKTAVKQLSRKALKALGLIEPPSVPRLTWVRGKTYKQANGGRKNHSGHLPEHTEALLDDAKRTALKLSENPAIVEALAEKGLEINTEAL